MPHFRLPRKAITHGGEGNLTGVSPNYFGHLIVCLTELKQEGKKAEIIMKRLDELLTSYNLLEKVSSRHSPFTTTVKQGVILVEAER